MSSQVEREAYSLLRLCKDLQKYIHIGKYQKTYLKETLLFLTYIEDSLGAISSHASSIISDNNVSDAILKVRLKDLGVIETALNYIYKFTKQAIDADSLSIPFSLITYLNHVVRGHDCLANSSLVVLSESDLMYYKMNLKHFRKLTQELQIPIPEYPELSGDLGILKFPFSAANDVLINCILFHEAGHFVYEKTKLPSAFEMRIYHSFKQFASHENIYQELVNPLYDWKILCNYVTMLISRWLDEMFADCYAIKTLGAAYHFSGLELLQVLPIRTVQSTLFCCTHPADDYRFKMQKKWLEEEAWLDVIQARTPWIYDRLEESSKLNIPNDFAVSEKLSVDVTTPGALDKVYKWMLEEFEDLLKDVETEVANVLNGCDKPIQDFELYGEQVEALLEFGVVPSTVYANSCGPYHPKPCTVLNSGFLFYLQGMKPLLDKVESTGTEIDKRIGYSRRLSDWLGKAIDDWQFIQVEREMK